MLLKFAVKEFKEDREFKNLSESTINSYMYTLEKFYEYCSEQEIINVEDVSSNTIKSFLNHYKKYRNNNSVTINTRIKHLKVFFNFMVEEEVINEKRNPMKKIEFGKTDVKIEVFTDQHVNQMLKYLRTLKTREKTFHAYRNYTIILTLLGTGMRLGEIANLRWNDIDLKNGIVTVFGKKRQQTSLPITERMVKEFAEYKVFCLQQFEELSEYVFVTLENDTMGENAFKCVFKRLKKIMNFKDVRLSAYTFRHTFAHRFLMNGGDVFTLKKLLRHSNLRMTEQYLALWGTALREQAEKYNPLNNLDL